MDLFGEEPAPSFEEESLIESETAPEETLPEPRLNPVSLGHEENEKQILTLIHEKRMPHALIFSGSEGIGKATFAFRLARFLLTQTLEDPNQDSLFGGGGENLPQADSLEVPQDNPVFQRVASGGHADLFVAECKTDDAKGKKAATLDVAEIRKIAPFLRLSAAEGGWRIVLIDDADTMNRNAQNALLKILEEPPPNVLIVLITHRVGALIPTIRSRARVLEFAPLSTENLTALLQKKNHFFSSEEIQTLNLLAEGSLGKALHLIEEGGLSAMEKILSIFENYPDWKLSEIHKFADEISRAGQDQTFFSFQNIMQWMARQLATNKARGTTLTHGPLALDVFDTLLRSSSLEHLIAIYDALQDHFKQVNHANLERRHSVLKAFQIFT